MISLKRHTYLLPNDLEEQFCRKIGYFFCNPNLLYQALSHAYNRNQRLEFLGDSLLNFIISEYLHNRHPNETEALLTIRRTSLVSNQNLATVAKLIGLLDVIQVDKSINLTSKTHDIVKPYADALEAIFAAIYLDGGLEPARASILWVLKPNSGIEVEKATKTLLQEVLQAQQLALPKYILTESSKDMFTVICYVRANEIVLETKGSASNKKEAEAIAAHAMLKQLEINS